MKIREELAGTQEGFAFEYAYMHVGRASVRVVDLIIQAPAE